MDESSNTDEQDMLLYGLTTAEIDWLQSGVYKNVMSGPTKKHNRTTLRARYQSSRHLICCGLAPCVWPRSL